MNKHKYRYVFADVITGRPVTALDLRGVRWDRRISQGGAMTGRVYVTPANSAACLRVLGRGQSPHALHIWRDAVLAWSGFVNTRVSGFDGDSPTIQVTGVTWEGYPSRRYIQADTVVGTTDPYTVLSTLWAQMQAAAGGSVRVAASGQTSGTTAAYGPWLSGDSKRYGDAIADVVAAAGMEWVVDYSRSVTTGIYSGKLRVGKPIGQASDVSPHVLIHSTGAPDNAITGWTWTENLDAGATAVQGVGGQDPDLSANVAALVPPALSSQVWLAALIASGLWLRVDQQVQDSDIRSPADLDALAIARLAKGAWKETASVIVDLDQTTFQPGSLGDYVRLIIRAPHLQLRESRRVIGIAAVVNDDGTDTVTLTFEGDA